MNDAVAIAPAVDELETRIAAAYETAMKAMQDNAPNKVDLWNQYLDLRQQRPPERVRELEEQRLEQARTAPRMPQ